MIFSCISFLKHTLLQLRLVILLHVVWFLNKSLLCFEWAVENGPWKLKMFDRSDKVPLYLANLILFKPKFLLSLIGQMNHITRWLFRNTFEMWNVNVYVYSLIPPWVQQTSQFTPLVLKLSLIQSHLLWGECSIWALWNVLKHIF